MVRRFRDPAGAQKVSPHSLRHYFGASLISHGVPVVAVSRWLGQSSPEISYRVHAYLNLRRRAGRPRRDHRNPSPGPPAWVPNAYREGCRVTSTPASTGIQVQAVLFDLDGTLVDSTAAVERCWRRWAAEFGVRLPAVLEHGLPARTGVSRYLPVDRIEAGVARMEQLEVSDTEGIVALPGATDALATVGPDRAAVVTSCTTELAKARISAAGIAAPNILITVDQVAHGKPDPEGFLLAAHRLGVDPGLCLVVEDAPSGLAAATAAGCATIALATTSPRTALVADVIVDSLADVRFETVRDGIRVSID